MWTYVLISLRKIAKSVISGSCVICVELYKKLPNCFSFCVPTSNVWIVWHIQQLELSLFVTLAILIFLLLEFALPLYWSNIYVLLTINRSSFMKCLFKSLAYFLNWIISLLISKHSLYNLNISPLSDLCSANICSNSVACLFISLTVSFKYYFSFSFEEIDFIIFFFWFMFSVLYLSA